MVIAENGATADIQVFGVMNYGKPVSVFQRNVPSAAAEDYGHCWPKV